MTPEQLKALMDSKTFNGLQNAFNLCLGLCNTSEELEALQGILGAFQSRVQNELTLQSLLVNGTTAGTDQNS